MQHLFLPRLLLAPDGAASGSAASFEVSPSFEAPAMGISDPNDAPDGDEAEPEPISPHATIQELRSHLERATRRNGELLSEKRKLKAKLRHLAANSGELESEVALWRTLGSPASLATRLKAADAALAEQRQRAAQAALEAACDSPQTSVNASALRRLIGSRDVVFSTQGEGEAAEGFVTFQEGDEERTQPLAAWVREEFAEFEASLFLSSASGVTGASQANQAANARTLTPVHRGAPPGGGQNSSVYDRIRQRNQQQQAEGAQRPNLLEKAREAGMVR